jgi:hypothetical protein
MLSQRCLNSSGAPHWPVGTPFKTSRWVHLSLSFLHLCYFITKAVFEYPWEILPLLGIYIFRVIPIHLSRISFSFSGLQIFSCFFIPFDSWWLDDFLSRMLLRIKYAPQEYHPQRWSWSYLGDNCIFPWPWFSGMWLLRSHSDENTCNEHIKSLGLSNQLSSFSLIFSLFIITIGLRFFFALFNRLYTLEFSCL